MVVTCSMDVSFRDGLTPLPWHADAVGGRPPHHPTRRFAPAAPDVGFAPDSGRSDAYG
jgi:hypothetical protein